jgi:hypothetical protein
MLALLVVGEAFAEGARAEPNSSLEVLHARDAGEAVEKLARNRRVDGVLVLSPGDAAAIVAAIREDVLSPPPIFLPEGAPEIRGTWTLAAREPARLLALVVETLGAGSSLES